MEASSSIPVEQQIVRTAHHEASHIVAAAVQGLKLRYEGLGVDSRGEGLACYCKQPGESDERREKVIITTFSGYNGETRLCAELSFPPPDQMQVILSLDGREARPIISSLSYCSAERTPFQVEEELQQRSRGLIDERWAVIRDVADALLSKEWEGIRPLPSGGVWSQVDSAKYLDGSEIKTLLARHGIHAELVETC